MVKKASGSWLAALTFAMGLPIAAQSDSFAERERALQRELAAQQRAVAEQGDQAEHQRAVARGYAAQQREYAAGQREFVAQQREQQQESAEHMRELARELAKAKAQLAASAAEIGRLSAQLSRPVVRDVQNSLRAFGQRAILGIVIEDGDAGVRVTGVTPSGPAAGAGVQVGDTIVAIDGIELARRAAGGSGPPTAALLRHLGDVEEGSDVELRILRDGTSRNIVVEAGSDDSLPFRLDAERFVIAPPGSWVGDSGKFFRMLGGRWNDVELVSLTPALGEYFGVDAGLLVVRAGNMGELGLRDGDVLLEIGGREPQTPEHAMRILASFEPGEPMRASIMRQKRPETLTMTVPVAARDEGIF